MRALVAALALWGQGAAAGEALPWLYRVTGVGADDVLNVRAEPSSGATAIGRFGAGEKDIEVVGLDASGRWGRVNLGETAGWTAMRYLAREPGGWDAEGLPAPLTCFGTEPFWSFEAGPGGKAVWGEPGVEERNLGLEVLDTGIPGDVRRALVGTEEGAVVVVAAVTPGSCTDGMSDRAFGLEALVVLTTGETRGLRSGCCSLGR